MINMNLSILNYLKTDRSFDAGVSLYNQFGNNKSFLRKLNLQGNTGKNLEMLHYQLFKLMGYPSQHFNHIMSRKVVPAEKVSPPETTPDKEKEADPEIDAPKTLKTNETRLREEFPFLADPACPDSLKVLVADMLTAHDKYVRAHAELFQVKDEKEAFETADQLVSGFMDNQAIWKELNHFKKTGKILGEHFYFTGQKRREELTQLSIPELMKLLKKTEYNLWRNKKKLEEDPNPKFLKARQKRIAEYELDLKILNNLVNING